MNDRKCLGDKIALTLAGLAVLAYLIVGIIAFVAPTTITEGQITLVVRWAVYFFLGAVCWGAYRGLSKIGGEKMTEVVLGHGCDHAYVAGPNGTQEVILLSRLKPPGPKRSTSGRHHRERPARRSHRRRRAA